MLPKFSKNTRLLSLASFLTDVSTEMVLPIIPFFLTSFLGAPAFVLGIIEGIRDFIADFFSILSGI